MNYKSLRLRFEDSILENEFVEDYAKNSIWKTRLISITAAVLFLFYATFISDLVHSDHTPLIWKLVSLEVVITIVYLYFSYSKNFLKHFRKFAILYSLALGIGCFSPMIFAPNDAGYYYIYLSIAISATFILAGTRVLDSLFIILTLVTIALGVSLIRGVESQTIITSNFIVFAITIFNLVGGYLIEKSQRDTFLRNLELEELSYHDGLTSLKNRRFFTDTLTLKCEELKRYDKKFILMILDVDNFKAYNDCYGHPKGDEALVKLSKALKSTLKRATDDIFRIGGEEFAIILNYENEETLKTILQDMINRVLKLNIEHIKNENYNKFSISIGAAYMDNFTEKCLDNSYKHADKALYKAKENGKNCYVIYDDEEK